MANTCSHVPNQNPYLSPCFISQTSFYSGDLTAPPSGWLIVCRQCRVNYRYYRIWEDDFLSRKAHRGMFVNINIAWVRYKRDRMRGRVLHKLSLVMQKTKLDIRKRDNCFCCYCWKNCIKTRSAGFRFKNHHPPHFRYARGLVILLLSRDRLGTNGLVWSKKDRCRVSLLEYCFMFSITHSLFTVRLLPA